MTNRAKKTWIKLSGHLRLAGIVHQLKPIFTLHELEPDKEKLYRIDCREISCADMYGLQFLYVWMQCATMRGIKAELVNLTDEMQQTWNIIMKKETHN